LKIQSLRKREGFLKVFKQNNGLYEEQKVLDLQWNGLPSVDLKKKVLSMLNYTNAS